MIRTGIGYDVHQFSPDRKCILGGVDIPSELGLIGHSDADVLCHAIADALLGALGLPDIGHYFPPGDPACKDISSLKILEKAASLADDAGFEIANIDSSIVAEAPRVLPHAPAMKKNIGQALKIEPSQVGIKATTNETMGFVGRKEGMAAFASALIIQKGLFSK